MVWLHVAVFPHSSVAVQVRVTEYLILPRVAHVPGLVTSTWLRVTAPQASLVVGSGKTGTAGHSIVAGPAQVTVGAAVSCTVIVWLQVAVFPHSSAAVQVRVTE